MVIIENFLKSSTIVTLDKSASLNLSYLMHIKSVMIDEYYWLLKFCGWIKTKQWQSNKK
ncbi:hypothetical protein [Mycoplasmopsis canis]|uniref:hypothetical protein n=1 Tax=Mycoplasmopsis canis TaxID=29555 RepID=UPI0012BA9B05|nr:hypothetical protein [Mycoplasmopsis canis]